MHDRTTSQVYAHNRQIWDERVARRLSHTRMAADHDFARLFTTVACKGWIQESVLGKSVLCLAAGGGMQGALFAAAGARVTVVDLSPAMLEQDRRVATERGLTMRLIEGSMDDLSMLAEASFDLVVQPVSTCYVPDVGQVYRQVARVAVPGGLYLSQHKQPTSLQASTLPETQGYTINERYYRHGPLPPALAAGEHREAGALEFLHSWEALLGGLCRNGFIIEDVREPDHTRSLAEPGTFGHRSQFIPPYVAIKARRRDGSAPASMSIA